MATVGEIVRGIRCGRFDLSPREACGHRCQFRQICHYSQARSRLKEAAQDAQEQPQ